MTTIDFNAANNQEGISGGATFLPPVPPPTKTETLDIDTAKNRFAEYEAKIEEMLIKANSFEVVDDKTNIQAVEFATGTKRLFNEIEKLRKAITDEPRNFTSAINNFAKVYTARLKKIENIFKSQISSYAHKIEMKRRDDERKAQKEAEELQAKINEEAKEKKIEPVHVPDPVLKAKPEPTRTESGSASVRKSWKWKEVDMSNVPREYLMLDTVKINKAVRAGARNIPGLEIYEESTTVLRT